MLVPRFVINARFEVEPGSSLFLPRIIIEEEGEGEEERELGGLRKKAKLPVFTHDESKQVTRHVSTAKNGAGPVIKGSVSITSRGRDGEEGKKLRTVLPPLFRRIGKGKKLDAKFSRGWKFVLFCN